MDLQEAMKNKEQLSEADSMHIAFLLTELPPFLFDPTTAPSLPEFGALIYVTSPQHPTPCSRGQPDTRWSLEVTRPRPTYSVCGKCPEAMD